VTQPPCPNRLITQQTTLNHLTEEDENQHNRNDLTAYNSAVPSAFVVSSDSPPTTPNALQYGSSCLSSAPTSHPASLVTTTISSHFPLDSLSPHTPHIPHTTATKRTNTTTNAIAYFSLTFLLTKAKTKETNQYRTPTYQEHLRTQNNIPISAERASG
jgi:hypothetical protein